MSDIQSTIVNVGQNLNPESIDKATDLLANAKSITFFGLGGSGPVALDAQHKFFFSFSSGSSRRARER